MTSSIPSYGGRRFVFVVGVILLIATHGARAADFNIADGDVDGLIAAVNTANTNGEADTINLAAGGTYEFLAPDVLPTITTEITINGSGATIRIENPGPGAVHADNATLTLNELTIRDSESAVFANGNITIARCTFIDNRFTSGAAPPNLRFSGASLHMTDTLVSDNVSTTGTMHVQSQDAVIAGCLFTGNEGSGLLALSDNSTALITNCTFSDNGGPSVTGTSAAVLRHCTIVNSDAQPWMVKGVTLTRSIVALHNGIAVFGNAYEIVDGGFNIIEDGSGITDPTSMSGDPLLTPLSDFGGPNETHALFCNSPAIDAAPCLPDVAADQRGVARPQGANCDIGAYEADVCATACTFPDLIPDGDVNALIDAIDCANARIGADTINLEAGGSYEVIYPDVLPTITSEITLNGNGADIRLEGVTAAVISASDATVTLNDLTIRDSEYAISASGDITIARCAFIDNHRNGGPGPPILNFSGTSLHLSETRIRGNFSSTGTIWVSADSAVLSGCTFTDNGARVGLYGAALITNCTFSDNVIPTITGTPDAVLRHCTIANQSQSPSPMVIGVTLTRSIVTNSGGPAFDGFTEDIVDGGYNIIEDGSGITDPTSMSGDPMLTALADRGGLLPTHGLFCNSPAIDAAPCLPDVTVDQRDVARPQGANCDIGAFEADVCVTPCTIPDPIPDGDADALIGAVVCANETIGAETINLAPGGSYVLARPTELPTITTDITINGQGATLRGDSLPLIEINSAAATLADLTVRNSRLVINASGDITIARCAFTGNFGGPPFDPAILVFSGSSLHMTDTLISNNFNSNGSMWVRSQDAVISECLFTQNSNLVINLYESAALLTNCTFSNNEARIVEGSPAAVLRHCTVANNDSTIVLVRGVTLTHSIVAYNQDDAVLGDVNGIVDGGYNIIEDGSGITEPTSFSGDPLLGPLADNGGPTHTHALLPGSPAIDMIPAAFCDSAIDQRGVLRPQGVGCDIGAFEAVGVCGPDFCPPDTVPLVDRDGDFAGWCVGSSNPEHTDIYVDAVRLGQYALIEVSHDFVARAPITLTFQQVCHDDSVAVPTIYIADESLTNLSGVDWPNFSWRLAGDSAWFHISGSNGFSVDPFTTRTFEDYLDTPAGNRARTLRAENGVVPNTTNFFAGYGTGELRIDADLAGSDAPVVFDLSQSSSAIEMLGDFDTDGDVDLADFSVFSACFGGSNRSVAPACESCDLDADSDVDLADFSIFSLEFTGAR